MLAHLCLLFDSWHPLYRAKTHKSLLVLIVYSQNIQILARYLKALSLIMNIQSWNNKLKITQKMEKVSERINSRSCLSPISTISFSELLLPNLQWRLLSFSFFLFSLDFYSQNFQLLLSFSYSSIDGRKSSSFYIASKWSM